MTTRTQREKILAKMRAARGGRHVSAEELLAEAAAPEHPLHGDFQWDDSAAAHAWRMQQARAIVRTVQVATITDMVPISCVAYVRDPALSSRQQGYLAIDAVTKKSEEARSIIHMLIHRIRTHVENARSVAGALGLMDEFELLLQQVCAIEQKLAAKAKKAGRKKPGVKGR